MKTFVISSQRNKKINLDISFTRTSNQPLVIFSHGFKGFKDWGAWGVVMDALSDSDRMAFRFDFTHNGVHPLFPEEIIETEKLDTRNLAFISPYNGQVQLAKEHLSSKIRISTIDSFQGQEKEIVILTEIQELSQNMVIWMQHFQKEKTRIINQNNQPLVLIFLSLMVNLLYISLV